jgi:nucleotide-binding universal stress UspA family protein
MVGPEGAMFQTIVVGTDGSPRAEVAVREAVDLARSEGARLHIVAAFGTHERHWEDLRTSARVDSVDLRAVAESLLERAARKAQEQGVEVDWGAREGDPAEAILEAATDEDADLIVVGNKGMTGAKRFVLGGVPNKVSHHAPCSVLVVRTD